ncbi:uncharacterized protein LOC115163180 isoform X3 [Salmo trutta]|uniref:uncharacterized protein LOC115163180 isoform X3 n=1 Tax=Salmo trutta TaxID=8032 RepID=UPI001131226C|nr:uncharacterized protein LOC115163180 isoform X3 [Salmo trutta]
MQKHQRLRGVHLGIGLDIYKPHASSLRSTATRGVSTFGASQPANRGHKMRRYISRLCMTLWEWGPYQSATDSGST